MADLDEATRKQSMADLVAAARTEAPLSVQGQAARGRLADAGLARMERLRSDLVALGTKEERRDVIAALMADESDMRAIRVAFGTQPDRANAAVMRLRNVPQLREDLEVLVRSARLRVADEDELPAKRERVPFRGHPGPDKLLVPSGYRLDDLGVWAQTDEGETRIALCPAIVVRVARDEEQLQQWMTVAWLDRGRWRTADVERGTVSDSRKLVALSNQGFPVDSTNAGAMVRYLGAFESENKAALPEEQVTSRMGWHGDVFVWGETAIPGGLRVTMADGERAMAALFRQEGTWEGWVEAMRVVAGYPSSLLAVYASAAAPLLEIVGQQGFIVDWSGTTSRGKTTTMRVAASVWGLPDDSGGVIQTWASASMVGAMATAALYHSLPVMMDDTKRGKPAVIGAVMYDLPAGQDRLRGTESGGLRRTRRWRTILLSNGEAAITNFNSGAGSAARALCIRGYPMGEDNPTNAAAATAIKHGLLANYGHLGPRLIRHYQASRTALKDRFGRLCRMYDDVAKTAVGHRVSAYLAVLHLAAEVCTELGVPGDMGEAMGVAESGLSEAEVEADRPAAALAEIGAWIAMSRALFLPGERPPGGTFIGVVGATHVYILAKELRSRLRDCGFDADAVLESWAMQGVLKCDPKKRTTVTRIDGTPVRVVAIDIKALESVT